MLVHLIVLTGLRLMAFQPFESFGTVTESVHHGVDVKVSVVPRELALDAAAG